MHLVCTRRCGGELFRALFAEVELDASGGLQDYRIAQPGYVCLSCGAPALDLSQVPGEIEAEQQAEAGPHASDVLCPVCETMVRLDSSMECPNCGSPLEAV
jgi:DNA-directed RNA polymerase subunit RPC12/RpoP